MAQVEKLLKYQECDEKLLKLERETSNSEERKNYVQAKNFLTKAPEKLEALDGKARELTAILEQLNKKYAEIEETLSDFDNLDELVDGGADISFYKKNALQIADRLKAIKAEITALSKTIKEADEEYQSMKKKTISVQGQYKEYSEAYKKLKDSKLAEATAIKKELTELAKDIKPDVLEKYNAKRSERIFPILCPVKDGRCSKCGTGLSILGNEQIAVNGVTECENCHRILYKG